MIGEQKKKQERKEREENQGRKEEGQREERKMRKQKEQMRKVEEKETIYYKMELKDREKSLTPEGREPFLQTETEIAFENEKQQE